MTEVELKTQEQIAWVFKSLKKELQILTSEVYRLKSDRINIPVLNGNSNCTIHRKLNNTRTNRQKKIIALNVQQWIYNQILKQQDSLGYFKNYPALIKRIDIIKAAAVRRKEFEIAEILTTWENRLP